MELRQIRYFLSVARRLNFTRAAAELFVAQPALSHQVKQLEDRKLGAKLFDRGTRHVGLTNAGRALLPLAQRILADLDAIERTIRETVQLESGLVQLGAQQSVTACGALPICLWHTARWHPGIDVVMQEESVEEALTRSRIGLTWCSRFQKHHSPTARFPKCCTTKTWPLCWSRKSAFEIGTQSA